MPTRIRRALRTSPAVVLCVICSCGGGSESSGPAGNGTVTSRTSLLAECTGPAQCEGLVCLTLKQNPQNKAGICTAPCADDSACAGGKCVDIPATLGSGISRVCFASCATDADCGNGFVCVESGQGPVCFVRSADGPTPCTTDADCTEPKAQCFSSSTGIKGCSRALDAPDVFERECSEETIGDCPGFLCLTLNPNAQNKSGICSLDCADDTDCPGGACVAFGDRNICLASCTDDEDCANGFVCVPEGPGSTRQVCLVEPT